MENYSFDIFNQEQHQCLSHREGDWIIFHCPICKDYERRINWKTREVKVRRGSSTAAHAGSHAPVSSDVENFSIN
ncbi:MAG: hypothetical protein H6577_14030 [Lewinellaceae bacterium]|nr:hypothetical protein [Saprospiraceae bacterium]MCB9339246.1 hypothetical protein [Lewinellaceae bacterium]